MNNHPRRLLGELVWQLLTVAVTLIDRIVVVGLLYKVWGQSVFDSWASVLAISGLFSLFDFGLSLYVSNTISRHHEVGDKAGAHRFLAISNFMMVSCATVGLLAALVISLTPDEFATGIGRGIGLAASITFLLLSASTLVRIASGALYGLYRAHGQFSRLTAILLVGEVARMAGVLGIAAAGYSPPLAAAWTLAVAVALQSGFVIWDTRRRFAGGRIPVEIPARTERGEAFRIASGYWAQTAPILISTHLPVIALAALSASPGVVSTFVLVRTMTGLPRAILQQLGIVSGQEIARLVAVDDQAAARLATTEAVRTTSALSGLGAGALAAAGGEIGSLWVGDRAIFTPILLVVGLLPMLLAPGSVLSHNILASTNRPLWAVYGRWAQLVIGAGIFFLVPIPDLTLRVLLALSIGEVFGFAPLASRGSRFIVPSSHTSLRANPLVNAFSMGIAGYGITSACLWFARATPGAPILLALAAAGLICFTIFYFGGLNAGQRQILSSSVRSILSKPK